MVERLDGIATSTALYLRLFHAFCGKALLA